MPKSFNTIPYDTITDIPTEIQNQLTVDIVSSASLLHKALLPMLCNRLAPVSVRIPAFSRVNGSMSKVFDFIVALREHPEVQFRTLFPFRLTDSHLSVDQRQVYSVMSAANRQAYNLLYAQADWNANVKACRNIYMAAFRLSQRHCDNSSSSKLKISSLAAGRATHPITVVTGTAGDSQVSVQLSVPETATQMLVSYNSSGQLKTAACSLQPAVVPRLSSYRAISSALEVAPNLDPDAMLQQYAQELAESNQLTPQMAAMLNRAIHGFAAHQTVPIPMMLSSQSARHPFYDIIRHHACYNTPSLALNIEAVIKQLAMERPDTILHNLPGVAHVPVDLQARVRLPALIKTSFHHPTHGAVTAVALLLHMDTPRPEHIKAK